MNNKPSFPQKSNLSILLINRSFAALLVDIVVQQTKKPHRSLVEGIHTALVEIFIQNRKSDKVLQQLFKANPKWGARDRGFIAESTYEIVRWWAYLHFLNQSDWEKPNSSVIWQIIHLQLFRDGYDTSAFPGYKQWDRKELELRMAEAKTIRYIKASIPQWMDELCAEQLGEKWDAMIDGINAQAPICLRVNTLKTTKEALVDQLQKEGVVFGQAPDITPDALVISERRNVFATQAFKQGLFEVQDGGSQCIATFLAPSPGSRVIDACAGAGGKSLHLATLMQNRGKVLSLDIEAWKLTELKRRAARNGIHIVETRLIEAKTIKRLRDSADALLLDVPCTGLGVLRRNPDAKWKIQPDFLQEITQTQYYILSQYAKMLRVGGKMVYATCSILPAENEWQVEKFLKNAPNFKLVDEKHFLPNEHGFDGFYMALLERID